MVSKVWPLLLAMLPQVSFIISALSLGSIVQPRRALVKMYTAGLLAGVPQVQAAMSKLMAPIEMNASSSSVAYPKQSNSSAAILAAVAAGGTATSRGQSEQPPIHIYIDGQEVTSKLGP